MWIHHLPLILYFQNPYDGKNVGEIYGYLMAENIPLACPTSCPPNSVRFFVSLRTYEMIIRFRTFYNPPTSPIYWMNNYELLKSRSTSWCSSAGLLIPPIDRLSPRLSPTCTNIRQEVAWAWQIRKTLYNLLRIDSEFNCWYEQQSINYYK